MMSEGQSETPAAVATHLCLCCCCCCCGRRGHVLSSHRPWAEQQGGCQARGCKGCCCLLHSLVLLGCCCCETGSAPLHQAEASCCGQTLMKSFRSRWRAWRACCCFSQGPKRGRGHCSRCQLIAGLLSLRSNETDDQCTRTVDLDQGAVLCARSKGGRPTKTVQHPLRGHQLHPHTETTQRKHRQLATEPT
jgi:hypothetical protein